MNKENINVENIDMGSSPRISVIIPVYNTAEFLPQCIDSVLGQTFKDIEIILVDDGSTDGVCPKMCDDYAAKDERVKVIHKENGGLMSAWIAGVGAAGTNYLSFIDSDDWIDEDMFRVLYGLIDSSFPDSQIISSNYIVEKASERRKETQALAPGEYTGRALEDVKLRLIGEDRRPVTMSRCMKLISKKLVLDNIKYCNTSIVMAEDLNMTLPCLCDCKRLVITEGGYFYHYRTITDSMSHGYNPKLINNLELTDKTFREILHDKKILNADHQVDREYVMVLLLILKNELRCREGNTAKRVKDIMLRPDVRKRITDTDVTITGKANKLLYFCIRHPLAPVIAFTKAILDAYDKKTN